MFSRLQYISQGNTLQQQYENIFRALEAGCNWIQLRCKDQPETELAKTAVKIKLLCEKYKATFIINDHTQLVRETGADGIHLGLDDMPVAEARQLLGTEKIIGGTANTLEHVLQRMDERCDYVGLGPFRFTTTKKKLSPILGIEGFNIIINALRQQNKTIPLYAIGGIELADVRLIKAAGVHGIAVSGLITNATNAKEIVLELNTELYDVVTDCR